MVRGEPVGKTSGATATTTATATPSTPSSATATATTTAHDEEIPYKKKAIPRALREQVWLKTFGKVYEHKCHISWCRNKVTVFDFHMGHNIPESKGGETTITNLLPICSRCNLSMSDTYSISEWERFGYRRSRWWERLMCIGSP
jgi:hypothetical protein